MSKALGVRRTRSSARHRQWFTVSSRNGWNTFIAGPYPFARWGSECPLESLKSMPLPFICAGSELIEAPISLQNRAFHQSYTQTTPKLPSSDSHLPYSAARSRTAQSNQNRLLKGKD